MPAGLIQCSNGHWREEKVKTCPHCPSNSNSTSNEKTQVVDNSETNADTIKTVVFGGSPNNDVQEPVDKAPKPSHKKNVDFTRTVVTGSNDEAIDSQINVSRKVLKGWLVTYDIDKYGVDFKIYEGRNTIGKSPENSITISDNEVSSVHAVLLYRAEKFLITDEMSTNGVSVNNIDLMPRDPYELNDGDVISIGSAISFLFRKSF